MGIHNIKIGIIGGTGFDDPENQILKSSSIIKCEDARNDFGLPSSDLYEGQIHGIEVVLLLRHRRRHEVTPTLVNYRANIEALRLAGCTHILASTACGSLSENIEKGQLIIPDSYIDRTVHRKNTFYDGTSSHYFGGCYLPMEPAFDKYTSEMLYLAAKNLQIPIQKGGTIVTIEGPRYSSKAESKMFQMWGGHLVNMTTCPEVCLAKEAGLLYSSIAMATDYDCWKDNNDSVHPDDVIAVFKSNVQKITQILAEAVKLIGNQDNWDQHIDNLKGLIKTCNVTH